MCKNKGLLISLAASLLLFPVLSPASTINLNELAAKQVAIWLDHRFTTYHWANGDNGQEKVRARLESSRYFVGTSLGLHRFISVDFAFGMTNVELHMQKPFRERSVYDEGISFKTAVHAEFPVYPAYHLGLATGVVYQADNQLIYKSAQDPRIDGDIDHWTHWHHFLLLTYQGRQASVYFGPTLLTSYVRGEYKNQHAGSLRELRLHGDRYPLGWTAGIKLNFHPNFKGTIEGSENNERALSMVLSYVC